MEYQDIQSIIAEISILKNQGIVLSDFLSEDRLLNEFEQINIQLKHGRYVLPKMYSLIKRIQNAVKVSLYNNDINLFIRLFSVVEAVRKKLGEQYQVRAEIASKVKSIRRLIDESGNTTTENHN